MLAEGRTVSQTTSACEYSSASAFVTTFRAAFRQTLSVATALLAAAGSVIGLLGQEHIHRRETPDLSDAAIAQDLVNLFIVAPLMLFLGAFALLLPGVPVGGPRAAGLVSGLRWAFGFQLLQAHAQGACHGRTPRRDDQERGNPPRHAGWSPVPRDVNA